MATPESDMRRGLLVVAVVAIAFTAGCVSAPQPGPAEELSAPDPTPTGDPPPDPETDRLGWEDGYWHNETLSVDPSDGLNESELAAVVARGKARVEAIRGLEFEEPVPVEIIDRETFRDRTTSRSDPTDAQRLHQDVKFEALFLMGEGEDAVTQQSKNTAENVQGYYEPDNHSITIVSESGAPLYMNEVTLAQELFHAVQEESFEVSERRPDTEEAHNAYMGIVEGDGNYVDYLYENRYEADLVRPPSVDGGGGGGGSTNVGMLALRLQPYSDGPPFVDGIREEAGWEGVNAVYDSPPASTEQTIHPGKYPDEEPEPVTIVDRSSEEWTIPDQGGGVNYASFGEAGLYVMLWYPSHLEAQSSQGSPEVIIPYDHFYRTEESIDLYNYSHPISSGWAGDRLYPYVRNDSAETGETGYVWRIRWDSAADAEQFRSAYLDLLEYHGATSVNEQSYRIEDGAFEDAFRVDRSGETVTIVNAPTVDDIEDVRPID